MSKSAGLAPIKRWSTKHEIVAQLSIGTMSVEDISKHTGYTKVRVSQILADPQAQNLREAVILRMREKMMEDIIDGLVVLSDQAVKRIAETITYEDFVPGSDAKKHQDNLSLGLLKGVGFLSGNGSSGAGREKSTPLNERLSERLVTALEESNKAEKLRQKRKEIIATDAVLVDSTG